MELGVGGLGYRKPAIRLMGLGGGCSAKAVSQSSNRECPLKVDWSHPAPPAEQLGSLIPIFAPYNDEGIQAEAPSAMHAEDLITYPYKFEKSRGNKWIDTISVRC